MSSSQFLPLWCEREKVEIPATIAYITMEGAGADKTIIEWDDTASRKGQTGHPLGTFDSATFAVNSPYFVAKNITFKVIQNVKIIYIYTVVDRGQYRIWS